jgi:hypothetical protein
MKYMLLLNAESADDMSPEEKQRGLTNAPSTCVGTQWRRDTWGVG